MAEHMTFNHGVRSSTLRWVTKKRKHLTSEMLPFFAAPLPESRSANPKDLPRTCATANKRSPPNNRARLNSDSPMGHL